MTENEQNIAIAEACGWTACGGSVWCKPHGFPPNAKKPTAKELLANDGSAPEPWEVPSYTTDLNACHEAESTLTPTQWDDYDEWLYTLQGFDMESMGRTNFHATAAQRAEAFLKTLGLWKES